MYTPFFCKVLHLEFFYKPKLMALLIFLINFFSYFHMLYIDLRLTLIMILICSSRGDHSGLGLIFTPPFF